jgi:hypothetical protein
MVYAFDESAKAAIYASPGTLIFIVHSLGSPFPAMPLGCDEVLAYASATPPPPSAAPSHVNTCFVARSTPPDGEKRLPEVSVSVGTLDGFRTTRGLTSDDALGDYFIR